MKLVGSARSLLCPGADRRAWLPALVWVLAAWLLLAPLAMARGLSGDIAVDRLPPEAQKTYQLIRSGGPFRYEKDGVVFGNRERLLPSQARGYYREYTVDTPGSRDRGARRIVCGGRKPAAPDVCYYTQDHYASFARIAP
jgi:ribonuclease T1